MGPGAAMAAVAAVAALVTVLVPSSEGAVSASTTPLKEVFREMRQLAEVNARCQKAVHRKNPDRLSVSYAVDQILLPAMRYEHLQASK